MTSYDICSNRLVCLAGTRDARAFLKKLGVGGKLAQTLVERYGVHTEGCLRKDPYSALFSIPGVSFRCLLNARCLGFLRTALPSLHTCICLTIIAAHVIICSSWY